MRAISTVSGSWNTNFPHLSGPVISPCAFDHGIHVSIPRQFLQHLVYSVWKLPLTFCTRCYFERDDLACS